MRGRWRPKPMKYPAFLRRTGRWDGQITRTRWNEYRRRFRQELLKARFQLVEPEWTWRDRARKALWVAGVWFRYTFGTPRIRLGRRAA